MTATVSEVQEWLQAGKDKGATHVIIVCNNNDYDNYPVYVMPGEDVRAKEVYIRAQQALTVEEVFNINRDLSEQMSRYPCFEY